jgi:3-methylfumaryl-CoA hydratase
MSLFAPDQIDEWRQSIGRREVLSERLEVESLRRYALAVGSDPAVEYNLPPLGHWAFFLPNPGDDAVGDDGHPKRGGFLPAITLPRRMFASANMLFEAPLLLGEEAQCASTIVDVSHKSGRSGDLVFVEVSRRLKQRGVVRVRERQSYVYRGDAAPTPLPVVDGEDIAGETWAPTVVNLFRFSAATFNGHRIHYDQPYATQVEGYPALVVHGPFIAAKLAGLAGRGRALASFAFRAQAPLFLGQPVRLQDAGAEMRAVRCDGAVAMTATVTFK